MTVDLFWHRADDPTITTVSGNVSSWPDKTGNSVTLAQGTAARRPALVSNWNGARAAVQFTAASSHWLQKASFTAYTQPYTIIVVGEFSGNNIGTAFDGGTDGAHRSILFANFANSAIAGASEIYAGTALGAAVADLRTKFVAFCVFNGNSSFYYINGTQIATGAAGAQTLNGLTVGADDTLVANFWNGYITELRGISGDQHANVNAWTSFLRSYWGF
jgi:hypothetical protein